MPTRMVQSLTHHLLHLLHCLGKGLALPLELGTHGKGILHQLESANALIHTLQSTSDLCCNALSCSWPK